MAITWQDYLSALPADEREEIASAHKGPNAAYIKHYHRWRRRNHPATIDGPLKNTRTEAGLENERARMRKRNSTPEFRRYRVQYEIKRLQDPLVKYRKLVCDRLRAVMKGATSPTLEPVLGCSSAEARARIERQFREGMTWDNYGKWQIDHIRPLATAKTVADVDRLTHISNLQPLWAAENRKKSSQSLSPS